MDAAEGSPNAADGSTCAIGGGGGGIGSSSRSQRFGTGGADEEGPDDEVDASEVGVCGSGGSGAGSEIGAAAAVGPEVMALFTASTRTHSAASNWQMATSTSSTPVHACKK
jgi:hypothetical protein